MCQLQEDDLHLLINEFPSGTRDFVLFTVSPIGVIDIVHPMDLLGTDRGATILGKIELNQPALSLALSLCRLLVPCLEYRGNRRHLVAEEWSELDVSGDTLFEDTRTDLARDLSVKQADEYRVITTGEEPPENSLAEIFWEAHTELPDLPDVFEDSDMSSLADALYFDLVPPGTGRESIRIPDIRSRIAHHWANNFKDLDVRPPVRQRRRVFKRILAVTVRLASQLNGLVAKSFIFKRLGAHQRPRNEEILTPEENALLELRYGGSPALRDINIGLLFGCGPLFVELVNDFAQAHVAGVPSEQLTTRTERLHQYVFLLGKFRQRRKLARAAEKRDARLARADRLPGGRREAARNHADTRTEQPDERALRKEDFQITEAVLRRLKLRDAKRLQALIDADFDRARAAEICGIEQKEFSRQWRQTVKKNVERAIMEVATGQGFGSLVTGDNEDGEEENED